MNLAVFLIFMTSLTSLTSLAQTENNDYIKLYNVVTDHADSCLGERKNPDGTADYCKLIDEPFKATNKFHCNDFNKNLELKKYNKCKVSGFIKLIDEYNKSDKNLDIDWENKFTAHINATPDCKNSIKQPLPNEITSFLGSLKLKKDFRDSLGLIDSDGKGRWESTNPKINISQSDQNKIKEKLPLVFEKVVNANRCIDNQYKITKKEYTESLHLQSYKDKSESALKEEFNRSPGIKVDLIKNLNPDRLKINTGVNDQEYGNTYLSYCPDYNKDDIKIRTTVARIETTKRCDFYAEGAVFISNTYSIENLAPEAKEKFDAQINNCMKDAIESGHVVKSININSSANSSPNTDKNANALTKFCESGFLALSYYRGRGAEEYIRNQTNNPEAFKNTVVNLDYWGLNGNGTSGPCYDSNKLYNKNEPEYNEQMEKSKFLKVSVVLALPQVDPNPTKEVTASLERTCYRYNIECTKAETSDASNDSEIKKIKEKLTQTLGAGYNKDIDVIKAKR